MNLQANPTWRASAVRTGGARAQAELPPSRSACTRRLCVPQLISAKAQADPAVEAMRTETARLSYGELERRSERLAGLLSSLGVGRDVPVAICLERSFDSIVCALAVWKAGGAYLPMDAAWPLDQRNFVVRHSGAPVLLTRGGLASEAPRVIDLDRDAAAIENAPQAPPCEVRRDDLAYVIYTSGTTGHPKGVEITHGNLLNFVFWSLRTWNLTPSDRAAHVMGTAFDAAMGELWPLLTAGASIELPDERTRTSADLLRDWVLRRRITILHAPTILAEPLLHLPWPQDAPLRWMTSGGDTLRYYPPSDAPFRLANQYGPTECTVTATAAFVPAPAGSGQERTLPPIGKPIANAQVYLLDETLQPVAPGKTGEIYIGGTGVGRGYRNQPDLTGQFFLDDPFSARPGARMYRSGDLGTMLPDGQIVFQGRADTQEKIRGHRIELDGIGAVLGQHPRVAACAVAARGVGEDRHLVAYVVPTPGPLPDSAELRQFVAGSLPQYMVPSAFVRLDALPMTANGKLDRQALPEPDGDNQLPLANYEAPGSPVEARLAEILAGLLHVPRIGRRDNFFLLGGHSLLATRVVLQVREWFSVDIRIRTVLEAQTVAALAGRVEEALLAKIQSLSEEEVQRLLGAQEG